MIAIATATVTVTAIMTVIPATTIAPAAITASVMMTTAPVTTIAMIVTLRIRTGGNARAGNHQANRSGDFQNIHRTILSNLIE